MNMLRLFVVGAHFAEGDHSFHGITITRFGHHDRSEATLWS
jgi:hypothetical protein